MEILVPVASVFVDRNKRQRQLLDEEIQTLAANIVRRGLLNPIVVERAQLPAHPDDKFLLIAGERRLEAIKRLGWITIPARLFSDLSAKERTLIEWAENAHRKDLPWQDRANTICNFHLSMVAENPTWTYAKSSEELGLSPDYINVNCIIAKAAKTNPVLLECTSWRQAYNAIARKFSRSLGVVLAEEFELADPVGEFSLDDSASAAIREATDPNADPAASQDMTATRITPEEARKYTPVEKKTHWEIAEGGFADWAEKYKGPPFNVIHCDFPYGVEFTNTGIFRKANALDDFYADETQNYWQLMATLGEYWTKLVARDAHLIFWYSMNFYEETKAFFNYGQLPEGVVVVGGDTVMLPDNLYVDPFPLFWYKSDNKGMMHDAKRKPRRIYETAFLITVGDQHLCRPGSNVFAGPTAADKHPSAKPLSAVKHFLRMVTDETSRVLDPTCGHGSAISAAIELGARAAYGIELDPTHVARARLEVGQTERRFLAESEITF